MNNCYISGSSVDTGDFRDFIHSLQMVFSFLVNYGQLKQMTRDLEKRPLLLPMLFSYATMVIVLVSACFSILS